MIAFDSSARRIDADGRMHVAASHISKAGINDYYGSEIDVTGKLGLESNKLYRMFRDPAELEKGAATFNNLPLLSKHIFVSANQPQKDSVVGSTGTDAVFNAPYLDNSLVIWDAVAIAGIQSRDQCEISCSYRFVGVMTPGAFEGAAFDGIMTQIVGNHVALVEVGRAGPDVVVSDAHPFLAKENDDMKTKPKRSALMAALMANLPLANDAQIDHKALTDKLMLAMDEDDQEQRDDESDEDYKKRVAKKAAKAKAEDETEEEAEKDEAAGGRKANEEKAAAMDAAIRSAESAAVKRMTAIRQAEHDVKPMVGEVAAMDSAAAVYKFALDHEGIDTDGIDPSALPALVKIHLSSKGGKPAVAQDSAAGANTFWASFKNITLPARG